MADRMMMVRQLLEIANTLAQMDEDGAAIVRTGRRGRPKGSKNKAGAGKRGRPLGSKNKPKLAVSAAIVKKVKAKIAKENTAE